MKSCIYQILNIVNEKFYIGHSQDYDVRWWEHSRKLKTNKHDNFHLQSAWNKYGENVFEFIIIELVEPNKILEREQYWINLLGACDKELGYNINPDALRPPSPKGRKHSAETKAKMSISMTGIKKIPHIRKPRTEKHARNIGFARKDTVNWPCPEGYDCGCSVCRPKRNRMKNYPYTYGNPSHELYRK